MKLKEKASDELNDLVSSISAFSGWKHPDKIKLFAWFIHTKLSKDRFASSDIARCYESISVQKPSSIHPFLTGLEARKPKQVLRDGRGFYLERSVREALDVKYGQRPVAIHIEKTLLELPVQVPDLAEREFLDEALRCYKAGAFRAAIVMCWNLAYDHLLTYILKHKLSEFNCQWPASFQKRNSQARVKLSSTAIISRNSKSPNCWQYVRRPQLFRRTYTKSWMRSSIKEILPRIRRA